VDLTGSGFEKLYEGPADLLARHESSVFHRHRPVA
jgi:hypothetical protein